MSLPAKHFYVDLKLKNKNATQLNTEDIQLVVDNIEYLTIKEHVLSILPRLEIVINDVGDLIETTPILDKDILSIVISNTKEDEDIDLDFNISIFLADANSDDNKYNKIKIVGYLNVNNMFVPHKAKSFNDNSADILKSIAGESGLSFTNPHSVKPNDRMIWYQGSNNYDFIKHILKRAFVDNDAVFFYANSRNNFVYTSMNSEMDKEQNFRAIYDRNKTENFILTDEDSDIIYYDAHDILNLTDMYNNISNYGAGYSLYNLKGEGVDNIITNGKKFTDLANKHKSFDGEISCSKNIGLISNPNVFKDFPKAIIQNFYFKYHLFSVSLTMNINSATKVKLFDKVNVGIPSTLLRGRTLNDVYSGNYLVTGITQNITFGSQYQKQILLSRTGINKSEAIKEYDVN